MESDTIKIKIKDYRTFNSMRKDDDNFVNTISFDKECGLRYMMNDKNHCGYFTFQIFDKHRYLIAKIKYGI
jgi:hypothetical protein